MLRLHHTKLAIYWLLTQTCHCASQAFEFSEDYAHMAGCTCTNHMHFAGLSLLVGSSIVKGCALSFDD